ncbi:hypothetical protein D3C79_1068050 [compost metagenome]
MVGCKNTIQAVYTRFLVEYQAFVNGQAKRVIHIIAVGILLDKRLRNMLDILQS